VTMPTAAGRMSARIRSIRAVPQPSLRADADACPGALRLHAAADGPLARVRVPGGRLTGAQVRSLRELAERWGDGHVELTSRANLQLRSLRDAPTALLAARLEAAGLLPSRTHELVRNIAASPLAGGSDVEHLDRALCADPRLASLPGRFLFALDSGAGDVAFSADVAALAVGRPGRPEFAVLFAGADAGLRLDADAVVPALLAAAHAFLDERAAQGVAAWRVRELQDGSARVAARTAAALGLRPGPAAALPRPVLREPVGLIELPGARVAVGALVPLGRLNPVQLKALESAATVTVTPWRGIVVPDVTPEAARARAAALADAGLEVAAGSRWAGVTACAGRPGCAKSLSDVRHDADAATTAGAGLPVHWIGCARGCGSPAGPHVRVEATGTGYRVQSPGGCEFAPTTEVGAMVNAARKG
jgi:precorrin-3B synthase